MPVVATNDAVMLARYQERVEEIVGILAGTASTPGRVALAVDGMLREDAELRSEAAARKQARAAAREEAEALAAAEMKEEHARVVACRIVEGEAALSAAIDRAERLLDAPFTRPLDPEAVIQYANFVAATTSAPPEWRAWRPPVAKVLMPFPLPYESVLPAGGSSLLPTMIPSMTNVSWLRIKALTPLSAECDTEGQPASATAKRPRETETAPQAEPASKKAATRVIAGLSDNEDDE